LTLAQGHLLLTIENKNSAYEMKLVHHHLEANERADRIDEAELVKIIAAVSRKWTEITLHLPSFRIVVSELIRLQVSGHVMDKVGIAMDGYHVRDATGWDDAETPWFSVDDVRAFRRSLTSSSFSHWVVSNRSFAGRGLRDVPSRLFALLNGLQGKELNVINLHLASYQPWGCCLRHSYSLFL
jgi:hypothetical protein